MNIINRISALALSVFALNLVAKAEGTVTLQTDADQNGTYLISTSEEFAAFVDLVNSGNTGISCRLMDDVEYSGEMIATSGPFHGTFDGNFFTLTVDIDATGETQHAGLFRETAKAVIRNLNLKGQIKSDCSEVAALIGSVSSQTQTINRCLIDVQVINTSGNNINKSFSGVVGEVQTTAQVSMLGVAFVGSFVEQNATSGNVVCSGFIGKDLVVTSTSIHHIDKSYMMPSFDMKSSNLVYYPAGNVYIEEDDFFGDMTSSTDFKTCYYHQNVNVVPTVQSVFPSSTFRAATKAQIANPQFVSRLDAALWQAGDSYPVLAIPTVVFNGSGVTSLYANWENGTMPEPYTNVIIKGSADIDESLTCRVFTIASTGKVSLSTEGAKLSAQSVILEGDMTVSDNTMVVTKDINAGSQKLILKYDASDPEVARTPALKYFGKFTGSAKIVRDIIGQRYYYMGSATEEMSLTNLSASTYSWPYSGTNWGSPSVVSSGSVLTGSITTPQLFGMDCKGVGTLTQVGTPAKSEPIEVTTKNKKSNMFTNPYPYSVDLRDKGVYYSSVKDVIGNTVYTRVFDSATSEGAYVYKTATYDIRSGIATNGNCLYPFQDVVYYALAADKSFVLPNKLATDGASIKSAQIDDVRRDYFSIAVYTGTSVKPSDEVALMFSDEGSMASEVDKLDSEVHTLYQNKSGAQENSQLLLRKPGSQENLAIAVYPTVNQMLDVEMPLTLIAKAGAANLTIEPLANFDAFETQADVYLKDNYTGAMVNLGKEPRYSVPAIDQLSEGRFAIVLKSKNATLTSISDAEVKANVNAYVANGKVVVDVPESFIGQNIDIYSTFGNKVLSLPSEKHNTIDVPKSGIYIVVVNGVKNKVSVK